jgi:hypothetical protein
MEALAARWIAEHPEYHAELADEAAALAAVYTVEDGRTNPFLHLSMHLSIDEQCSIDQPTGIRQAVQLLAARRSSLHEAHHEVMECLGEMIWASQRSGLPPDGLAYLEAVRRRATRWPRDQATGRRVMSASAITRGAAVFGPQRVQVLEAPGVADSRPVMRSLPCARSSRCGHDRHLLTWSRRTPSPPVSPGWPGSAR